MRALVGDQPLEGFGLDGDDVERSRERDGVPVAAQLWLVENEEALIHKLAYAEAAKAMSPGTILSMAMFRHVLNRDRVHRIDYGNGDEPYKADWMDERRTVWQPRAFNPRTVRGLASAVRAKLRTWRGQGGIRR